MNAIAVERSVWIDAPIERAWRAVTEPAQLTRWYATNFAWEIPALEVGATLRFHNSETEVLLATIEVVNPPRQFTMRWAPVEYGVTLVTTFALEEEDGGTRATIRETGYESIPESERQAWVNATAEGYQMSMENLKAHVEGRSLPH